MKDPTTLSKVVQLDKTATVTTVVNGFILQLNETATYKNGKTSEGKQVFVASSVDEVVAYIKNFLEENKQQVKEREKDNGVESTTG